MDGPYEAAFTESILRPEAFWDRAAEGVEWVRRWDTVLDDPTSPTPLGFLAAASTHVTTR